jgi:hypothetical protein
LHNFANFVSRLRNTFIPIEVLIVLHSRGAGPSSPLFTEVTPASIGEVKLTPARAQIKMRFENRNAEATATTDTSEGDMARRLCAQFGQDGRRNWCTKLRDEQLNKRTYEVRSGWTYELARPQQEEPEPQPQTGGWGDRRPPTTEPTAKKQAAVTTESEKKKEEQTMKKPATVREEAERKREEPEVKVLMAHTGSTSLQPVPGSMTEEEIVRRLCAHFGASQGERRVDEEAVRDKGGVAVRAHRRAGNGAGAPNGNGDKTDEQAATGTRATAAMGRIGRDHVHTRRGTGTDGAGQGGHEGGRAHAAAYGETGHDGDWVPSGAVEREARV